MNNDRYNYYKDLYPEWSEEQIWTAVSIDMQAAETIKQGSEDIDITDPDVITDILSGAKRWLKEVLPNIFERIGKFIDNAIASVVSWAKKGIQYLKELIENTFND